MDEKNSPNTLYTLMNQTKEKKDDDYHSNEENGEMQWTHDASTKELINIG
jgi:hypothetical protein